MDLAQSILSAGHISPSIQFTTSWVTKTRTISTSSGVPILAKTETVSPFSTPISPSPFTAFTLSNSGLEPFLSPHETNPITESLTTSSVSSYQSSSFHSMARTWAAPAQMTDLSAFNISSFTSGKHNLAVVQGVPDSASASPFSPPSSIDVGIGILASSDSSSLDNSSSVLQLLYPANSINPGNRPVGGAQFYASPLRIEDAENVTLRYSTFFPANFDFVLAGKLPGLYGGRTGCSGGDDAFDCFSTRLMWRKDGAGELYLHATKDKQSEALCAHPQSVCHSTYGLSIGRGSFKFSRGAWTTVEQRVILNTPGEQDGIFILEVDGRKVIERNDVFYRDLSSWKNVPRKKNPKKPTPKKSDSEPDGDLGDILDPLLGGLVGQDMPREGELRTEWERGWSHRQDSNKESEEFALQNGDGGQGQWKLEIEPDESTVLDGQETNTGESDTGLEQQAGKPVGFLGMFFSTFFGGHDDKYATPRDQYVWFKDFAISNDT